MASSYDNSSEEQTELRRLHHNLISEIYDDLDQKSMEYEKLIFHFGTYVPRGLIANKSSLDIFETLCTRKIITPGENYEKLKQICRDSGNDIYVDTIEKYEKKMEKVRSQHRYTGPQEAEKKNTELKRKFTVIETEQKEEIKRLKVEDSPQQLEYEKDKSGPQEDEKKHTESKRKFTVIETEQKEEIKRLKVEDSQQKQLKYEQDKSGCRTQLIEHYRSDVLKVSAIPLQPDEENYNFSDVYIRPTITNKIKKNRSESKEKEIKSMSELFTKNGNPQKFIYIVGDAGSGKSSFCKYLINCWCMAHSDGHNEDDEFEGVKEMKKFDFMFYISLRHNINIRSIQEMLEMRYDKIKNLSKLLENDSEKIIILLDGLDEWSIDSETRNEFQEGLPERDFTKKYTIVTTSRPWKIHSLRVSNREIHQLLKLKGFDETHEKEMIKKTITALNESLDPNVCEQKLRVPSVVGLKQVPIMLQQLVCLWCDGKLDKTSRCAIYTGMLELYFTWSINKPLGKYTEYMKSSQNVELPQYLTDVEICRLNSHLIYDVSRLAYETLFNYSKDKSLTFDKSVFDDLKISHEMRETCLKLGLLTEDKCPSFSVSKPKSSVFSFIHKLMQEFLAAVNIGINFSAKIGLSDSTENNELAMKFINEIFQKCLTVNDILEQSNVIIMLSGLEPRLATHVSKYIYDTVSKDSRVQKYRRTISNGELYFIDSDTKYIADIQKFMFESMEEFNAKCSKESSPVFYIGDVVITKRNQYCDIVCSSIDKKRIVPDSVLSINVDAIITKNVKFTKYLPMFHDLEKIEIKYESIPQRLSSTQNDSTLSIEQMIDEVNNCVSETIKENTSTLKSLSLVSEEYYKIYKTVVSNLPSMINLVAISMSNMSGLVSFYGITMSHDDTTTFCNFLERTNHLEQIHLESVSCKCMKQHDVNLSKHQQLQYLYLYNTVRVIDADTINLEIFKYCSLKNSNYGKIFDIITKSYKLKKLKLDGDHFNKSQLYHTNITKRLVKVLPLLHNLSKFELWSCRLTDNIIQSPLDMKSLKSIKLHLVIMSLTTWQKFVDSLPSIPHSVDVTVRRCYISGDGEEFNVDWLKGGLREGKGYDATQYVKDKDQLFHVMFDYYLKFNFSTKK